MQPSLETKLKDIFTKHGHGDDSETQQSKHSLKINKEMIKIPNLSSISVITPV